MGRTTTHLHSLGNTLGKTLSRPLAATIGALILVSTVSPVAAQASADQDHGQSSGPNSQPDSRDTADQETNGRDIDALDPGNGSTPVEIETPDGTIIKLPVEVASDDTVEVTNDGVIVTEPSMFGPFLSAEALDEIFAPPATGNGQGTESPSASDALTLHSRPGADLTIYLDFDGHSTSGTIWNTSSRPATIVSAPYGTDDDPAFDNGELEYIGRIWEMVAEDFSPFDVDVTTADPGHDRLYRDNSSDEQYGIRVVISPTNEWYGGAGGVAYINSLTWQNSNAPAFVFSGSLGNGYWKYVGEAASHETGHTLGLYHDGKNSSNYYTGHGSGANGWAPIMGVGYYRPVTQWSKGEYDGATETQDDMAILTSRLGLVNGAGGSTNAASIVGHDESASASIAEGGDAIEFDVDVGPGQATFTATASQPNSNVLVKMEVFSGSTLISQQLAPAASGWVLEATENLTAGTYRVRVTSVGWLTANDGFTDYASVGEITLAVNAPEPEGTTSTSTTTPPSTTSTTTTTTAPTTTTTTLPPEPEPEPDGDLLTSIAPQRLLDTRTGHGGSTRLKAGQTIRVNVTGSALVSNSATAAVLNVTAVGPETTGYLDVTPCIAQNSKSPTSTVNFVAGQTVANSTITKLDGADICVYSTAATNVLIDVTAWVGQNGTSALRPYTAERVVDTRTGLGIAGRLNRAETVRVDLADYVDSESTAVAVNLTATQTGSGGYLAAFPCSQGAPEASSLNFASSDIRANNAVVALDADSSFCVFTSSSLELIIDLTGEFGPTGLRFVPASPTRLLDTRQTTGRVAAGSATSYLVPPPPITASTVAAASVNITAVGQTTGGYITAWDCGSMPEASVLNPRPGEAAANGAVVTINAVNRSCLYTHSAANLIVDLNGWWV